MFVLSGCWDSSDIEKKNILSIVCIDYKDGNYIFSAEVANILKNLQGASSSSGTSYGIIKGVGKSFLEARDAIDRAADYRLYMGGIKVMLFSKEMGQNGIEAYMNRMRSDENYRKSIDVVNTPLDPQKLLSTKPENDVGVGDCIEDTLRNQQKMGRSVHTTAGDILQYLSVGNIGFVLPEIDLLENQIALTGYSIYKDAKYVGLIPAEQRQGLVYLLNPGAIFPFDTELNGNKLQVLAEATNKKIEPSYINENVNFDVNFEIKVTISNVEDLFTTNDGDIPKLLKSVEDLVKKDIEDTIKISQTKYGCDYLKFYKYFKAFDQSAFKSGNWEQMYTKATMNVNVTAEYDSSKGLELDKSG